MKALVTMMGVLVFATTTLAHGDGHKHEAKAIPEKVVKIEIGKKGFQPNPVKIKKGENLVLNITRTTKKTCMTALKSPKTGKLVDLPLNKETRFEVGSFAENKKVDLLCGMDMKAGVVVVN